MFVGMPMLTRMIPGRGTTKGSILQSQGACMVSITNPIF
jgi:hypothetical protein